MIKKVAIARTQYNFLLLFIILIFFGVVSEISKFNWKFFICSEDIYKTLKVSFISILVFLLKVTFISLNQIPT